MNGQLAPGPGLQLTNDCIPFTVKPITEVSGTVPLAELPLQEVAAKDGTHNVNWYVLILRMINLMRLHEPLRKENKWPREMT